MPDLARVAAELDVIELEAAAAELIADVGAGLIPAGATRGLLPHERRAGHRPATLDAEVARHAGAALRRLLADRAAFVAAVTPLLRRLGPVDGPSWLADAAGGPFTLPAVRSLLADAEAAHLSTLTAAYRAGLRSAFDEAAAQHVAPPAALTVGDLATRRLRFLARRMAAEPLVELVRRMVDAARRAPDRQRPDLAALAAGDDPVAAAVDAAAQAPEAGLATDHARAPAANAVNAGRIDAGDVLPPAAAYYASELLDGSTCGPCSLLDGREFATEDEARAFYPPDLGYHVRCEGGPRCRGTLVRVWDTEEAPTVPAPPRPPGIDAPPPFIGPERPIGPLLPSPPPPPSPAALTRGASQAVEADALRAARRLAAAEARADELAALDALQAEGWTAEQVAGARRDLDYYRQRARDEAARTAQSMEDTLAEAGEDRLGNPPRAVVRRRADGVTVTRYNADGTPYAGGEWDWWAELTDTEQKRLRRRWVDGSQPFGPDQLASIYADKYGIVDVDKAVARWLDLNRRADAGRALARGRLPSETAYGRLNVDELIPDSPFNAETLFGSDVDVAVRRILERYDDEAAEYAGRHAADEAAGELVDRLGPDPWDMDEDAFVNELDGLDAVYQANPDPVRFDEALGRDVYADDVEVALARMAELIPSEFEGLDVTNRDLYRVVVDWADRAGLRVEKFAADA